MKKTKPVSALKELRKEVLKEAYIPKCLKHIKGLKIKKK